MQNHKDEVLIPPPKKTKKLPRLNNQIKNLKVGESFISDQRTALCYQQFCRYHGLESVMRTVEKGKVRSWRIA